MSTNAPTTSRIPQFQTIEEEAEFWDTHDTGDFDAAFEDVKDVVFVPERLENGVLVHLEGADLEALRERASALGVRPSALVRQWILQHLNDPHPSE